MVQSFSDPVTKTIIICVTATVNFALLLMAALAFTHDGVSTASVLDTLTKVVLAVLLVSGPVVGHLVAQHTSAAQTATAVTSALREVGVSVPAGTPLRP